MGLVLVNLDSAVEIQKVVSGSPGESQTISVNSIFRRKTVKQTCGSFLSSKNRSAHDSYSITPRSIEAEGTLFISHRRACNTHIHTHTHTGKPHTITIAPRWWDWMRLLCISGRNVAQSPKHVRQLVKTIVGCPHMWFPVYCDSPQK